MLASEWEQWAEYPTSALYHHGGPCCAVARTWFFAMDRSLWNGHGAPTWIRRRFEWGPSRWPLHWCEAMRASELDCGAFAALTVGAFRARGIDAAPVQWLQRVDLHHASHWRARWSRAGASPEWAAEGVVYHEACAVITGDRATVWNPSSNAWASPRTGGEIGSLIAIRIGGAPGPGGRVRWGSLELPWGEWASISPDERPG